MSKPEPRLAAARGVGGEWGSDDTWVPGWASEIPTSLYHYSVGGHY